MRRYRFLFCAALAVGLLIPLSAEAAPYGAGYAPGALTCLTPNQVKTHSITVTNTGDLNWTNQQPNPFDLSYHWYPAGTTPPGQAPIPANQADPLYTGLRISLPNVVGGKNSILKNNVTLNANLKAPPTLGAWDLKWDMVRENVTWFSWQEVLTGDQKVEVKSSCPQILLELEIVPPKIDVVVALISNITPGGFVVVKGSLFGNDQGELWLKGLKKWNGVAYGDVKLAIATEPGMDFWTPTNVLGIIPGNITEVKDQPVKLQIKTKAGKWSNEYPVNFQAAKDWVTLKYTDPAVKLVSCGYDANLDECNGKRDPDDGNGFSFSCGQTFYGFHYNVWGAPGDDFGTDKFEITVKNGWVIDGGTIHVNVASGEGYTLGPGAVPSKGTSWKPSVQWNVSPNDDLCHGADVYISGPKGVPWK